MKKINSLEVDFFNLYKLAQAQNDVGAWQAALDKINSVEQNSVLMEVIDKLVVASTGLVPMLEAVKKAGVTSEELGGLIEMGKGLGAITASGIDIEKIEKFSSEYMAAGEKKREKLLKQAGIMDTIGNLAGQFSESLGGIPGTVAKLLPYASVIYKGITSITSLLSAFRSYQDLVGEAEVFGLKWYETLLPWKLNEIFPEVKNDPSKMGSLGYICAVASKFIEDGLVGVIRAVVASKEAFDIVMEVMNGQAVAATGLLGNLKPLLPLLQVLIEWGAGKLLSYGHKSLLAQVEEVINSHIGLSTALDPVAAT